MLYALVKSLSCCAVMRGLRAATSLMAAITAICERVGGLPLAIELAASRLGLLTPAALAERLDDALALLDRGPRDVPERQQTLRATLDWSFELLDARERDAFTALNETKRDEVATAAADQAVKCVRLIERVYRRAMPLLFEHADLKEALGRRELYWRLVAVSEHMRAIAERVWYAVVKEA